MARLRLGVGAKVTVLVSHLHPKSIISKAYVNHTKVDKVEGLVVVLEGPKLICHEDKVVIIFHHLPKHQQMEEFDCSTIHRFAHVTEEGEESGLFATPNSGGDNNGRPLWVSQPNPNIEPTTTHTTQTTTLATDGAQGNNNVPLETCWSQTYQGLTPRMQLSSATRCLGWLTMAINHCPRMSLCQLTKHQMPHNSSQIGSTPATATAALREEGGTRLASVLTQR